MSSPTSDASVLTQQPVATERARAKVNLALHVRGRRRDGYHDLDTIAVFADVSDELTVEPSLGDVDLAVTGAFAGDLTGNRDGDNLVVRAARAIAAEAGRSSVGAAFRLDKQLPVGAGLGGGSADAAATIRLLVRLWRLEIDETRLVEIADGIGADVPMCLRSRPVRARGRGAALTPIHGFPPLPLVLVHPGVAVSTAAVFKRLSMPADPALPHMPRHFGGVGDLAHWLRESQNGLEIAAREEAPQIGAVLQALAAAPGCLLARMSGAGSACFGIFPFHEAAERAARAIQAAEPNWWVVATTAAAE